jgi:hypothetical protein
MLGRHFLKWAGPSVKSYVTGSVSQGIGKGSQWSVVSLAFGKVEVNTAAATQSNTLASTGAVPVAINSATLAGAGREEGLARFPRHVRNSRSNSGAGLSFDPIAIVITQNPTGGYTFVWPSMAMTKGTIRSTAKSVSIHPFVVVSGATSADPAGPMSYN